MAYGDAGAHTGFERVLRGVMDYLHSTGEFDIIVQGLGYRGNPDFNYPYPVYPLGDYQDSHGILTVQTEILKHKPDVLWFVQDMWNLAKYMSVKPYDVPAVCYFPVDTPNMKWSYALAMGAMEYPVAYTRFGANEVAAGLRDAVDLLVEGCEDKHELSMDDKRAWLSLPQPHEQFGSLTLSLSGIKKWQNPDEIKVIPHGLDKELFKPMDKVQVRKDLDVPPDVFIVGSINANQFRKRQDLVFRAFSLLVHVMPTARLLMHCYQQSPTGWDLHQLARYYGVMEKTFFIHDHSSDLTDKDLCRLYNCCDVMINTSGGEGYGLTSAEGAACGVPQLVPDWSATRELWKDHGILLPITDWRMEPKFLNTAHANIDAVAAGHFLIELATNSNMLKDYQNKALEFAANQLTWDEVGARFAELLRLSVGSPNEAKLESFNDLLDYRKGIVRSELERAVGMEGGTPLVL